MAHEKHIRKLQRTSTHSYIVNVPKELIDEFGWREHQKLTLERWGDSILVMDWSR